MLEGIAFWYVNQSETTLQLVGYGVTILGTLLALSTHKGNYELQRAPYFAYTAIIFFAVAASQVIWIASLAAITGGYLWLFMLMDVFVGFAAGYGLGIIAVGRSRDAYGHEGMAILAVIPIANLWLLLTPSRNELSANRIQTIPLLTGGLGRVDKRGSHTSRGVIQAGICDGDQLGTRPDVGRGVGVL